jgi:hypothetical protein
MFKAIEQDDAITFDELEKLIKDVSWQKTKGKSKKEIQDMYPRLKVVNDMLRKRYLENDL